MEERVSWYKPVRIVKKPSHHYSHFKKAQLNLLNNIKSDEIVSLVERLNDNQKIDLARSNVSPLILDITFRSSIDKMSNLDSLYGVYLAIIENKNIDAVLLSKVTNSLDKLGDTQKSINICRKIANSPLATDNILFGVVKQVNGINANTDDEISIISEALANENAGDYTLTEVINGMPDAMMLLGDKIFNNKYLSPGNVADIYMKNSGNPDIVKRVAAHPLTLDSTHADIIKSMIGANNIELANALFSLPNLPDMYYAVALLSDKSKDSIKDLVTRIGRIPSSILEALKSTSSELIINGIADNDFIPVEDKAYFEELIDNAKRINAVGISDDELVELSNFGSDYLNCLIVDHSSAPTEALDNVNSKERNLDQESYFNTIMLPLMIDHRNVSGELLSDIYTDISDKMNDAPVEDKYRLFELKKKALMNPKMPDDIVEEVVGMMDLSNPIAYELAGNPSMSDRVFDLFVSRLSTSYSRDTEGYDEENDDDLHSLNIINRLFANTANCDNADRISRALDTVLRESVLEVLTGFDHIDPDILKLVYNNVKSKKEYIQEKDKYIMGLTYLVDDDLDTRATGRTAYWYGKIANNEHAPSNVLSLMFDEAHDEYDKVREFPGYATETLGTLMTKIIQNDNYPQQLRDGLLRNSRYKFIKLAANKKNNEKYREVSHEVPLYDADTNDNTKSTFPFDVRWTVSTNRLSINNIREKYKQLYIDYYNQYLEDSEITDSSVIHLWQIPLAMQEEIDRLLVDSEVYEEDYGDFPFYAPVLKLGLLTNDEFMDYFGKGNWNNHVAPFSSDKYKMSMFSNSKNVIASADITFLSDGRVNITNMQSYLVNDLYTTFGQTSEMYKKVAEWRTAIYNVINDNKDIMAPVDGIISSTHFGGVKFLGELVNDGDIPTPDGMNSLRMTFAGDYSKITRLGLLERLRQCK